MITKTSFYNIWNLTLKILQTGLNHVNLTGIFIVIHETVFLNCHIIKQLLFQATHLALSQALTYTYLSCSSIIHYIQKMEFRSVYLTNFFFQKPKTTQRLVDFKTKDVIVGITFSQTKSSNI